MTRLRLRYVPFSGHMEDHYEVIDQNFTRYGEPKPYDIAKGEMNILQASICARELEDAAVAGMLIGM